jgi:ELWxxDGT repeat protein
MKKLYLSIVLILASLFTQAQLPVMVSDIKPGAIGGFEYASTYDYYTESFHIVWENNGYIYFTAVNYSSVPNGGTATNNYELWRSDGTAAGTSIVKDIYPGNTGSYPGDFYAINGTLYFTATTPTAGRELWKTDGTTAGTVMVKDIKAGAIGGFEHSSTYDYYSTSFSPVWTQGNTFYFVAIDYSSVPNGNTPSNNYELWKSDGTDVGTVKVKDINSNGSTGSYPGDFYAFNGALYFTATTAANGRELWKTDGTTAGTVLVKDIKAGAIGGFEYSSTYDYYSTSFSPVWTQGNTFFFVAIDYSSVPNGNTPSNNYELWKSDGTDVGTVKVKDINSNGSTGSYPGDFYSNNGTLYFTATTAASGRELWKTDGTTAGTILVKDIKAGAIGGFEYSSTYDYYSTSFSPVWTQGNTFFFVAIDYSSVPNGSTANNNYELWKSDGTDVGTVKVKDVNSNGSTGSYPGDFYAFNGSLYFTATTAANGRELWKTDGTTAGTVLVKDIKAGAIGGFEYSSTYDYYSTSFSPVWSQGNTFYFVAIDYSSVPNGGTANNNFELWKSDGTGVGTVKVKDINSNGSTGSYPGDFYANNGTLYFTATTAASGRELWKTDGTTAGTVMVKEIKAGAVGGFEYASTYDYYTMAFTSPFSIGNDFYFVANDYSSVPNGNTPSNNYELWKSDGSAAGTSKVLDIHPSTTVGSYPGEFALALGKVFFAATDNTHGRELWVINAAATDVEELTSDQTLTLYPNPANDQLKIKWRSENLDQSLNKIEVSDLNGRSLLSETLTDAKGDFSYSLNVSNLSPGIYFVNLQGDGYNKTMKFVKQ